MSPQAVTLLICLVTAFLLSTVDTLFVDFALVHRKFERGYHLPDAMGRSVLCLHFRLSIERELGVQAPNALSLRNGVEDLSAVFEIEIIPLVWEPLIDPALKSGT
jgi:hypothetical protein